MGVTTYLLVRESDGAIIEEFDSPAAALRAFESSGAFGSGLSLMLCDDRPGALFGTTSIIQARLANFPTAADEQR
jgi:hypothetical protein